MYSLIQNLSQCRYWLTDQVPKSRYPWNLIFFSISTMYFCSHGRGGRGNSLAKPCASGASISSLSNIHTFGLTPSGNIWRVGNYLHSLNNVNMCSTVFILRPENVSQLATERPIEWSSDRATDRPSDRATQRSSDRANERSSDRAIERSSDRVIETSLS